MMEDELERIRAEKIKKLQGEMQRQQIEVVTKTVLFKFMTKEARERLSSVRSVRPQVAQQIELGLIQAVQMGQIRGQITDDMLKSMLDELNQKKEFKIRK